MEGNTKAKKNRNKTKILIFLFKIFLNKFKNCK